MPWLDLSDRQRKTVATAVTLLSVLVILAVLAAFFWLLARFFGAFSHVFLPLATAGIGALVCKPFYEWLRTRLRFPKIAALIAVFLSVLIPLAAFGWFFGALIGRQVAGLIEAVPVWWESAGELIEKRMPQLTTFLQEHPLGIRIREAVTGQQEALLDGLQAAGGTALDAGRGLLRALGGLAGWAMAPVYFGFFLIAGIRPLDELETYMPFFKPDTRKDVSFLIREFVNIMVAFFRGQLIIALLQGVLFAIGFSVVGLKYGLVLGMMLGILNVIPYLGSMIGLGIALPLAFAQQGGGLGMLIGVAIVFVVVQAIEGNLLTPRIMGDRTGLHPLLIIVAVFFWGAALGGIMGMILAIPLTAFIVVFWRLAREKYIQEWF